MRHSRLIEYAKARGIVIAALVFCGGAALWGSGIFIFATNVYEDLAYAIDPTPARAYIYGDRHFNSKHGLFYDVDRAERYLKAAAVDPSNPYVYHELSRIAFLKGNMAEAMTLIDIQLRRHGDFLPNSYYVRGLIEGFRGEYAAAAKDYAKYLEYDPHNWAAINDYAWVLLKDERSEEAAGALRNGLVYFPDNAWLLNSYAIALRESGDLESAHAAATAAAVSAANLRDEDWSVAYPGNDPKIAAAGLSALREAISRNIHSIEESKRNPEVQ